MTTYALPARRSAAPPVTLGAHPAPSAHRAVVGVDAALAVQADIENAAARQADAQSRANEMAATIMADIQSKFMPLQAQADAHWLEADRLATKLGGDYMDVNGLVDPSDDAAFLQNRSSA